MDEEALLKQFAAQFAHGPDDADDTDAAAAAQGSDSTANQATDDADQSPATFDTQQFLNGLDAIFDRHTAATEAGPYLEQAMVDAENAGDEAGLLTVLNETMGFYRSQGRHKENQWIVQRALELAARMGLTTGTSEAWATTLINCATSMRAAQQYDQAEDLYHQAQSVCRHSLAPTDRRLAALHNNLSMLYSETNRPDKAELELREALRIIEASSVNPDADIDVASSHTNLALTLLTEHKLEGAHWHAAKALEIYRTGHLEHSAHYASALAGFAQVCFAERRHADAVTGYRHALAVIEECYGKDTDYWRITADNLRQAEEEAAKAGVTVDNAGVAGDAGTPPQSGSRLPNSPAQGKTGANSASSPSTVSASTGSAGAAEAVSACPVSGLKLARAFWTQMGKPMIAAKYPQYAGRIAAGLVGHGSECYGFDDTYSQDHDFGPRFCLWLTDEDYAAIGEQLEADYEALPRKFSVDAQGRVTFEAHARSDASGAFPSAGAGSPVTPRAQGANRRDGVFRIGDFFESITGYHTAPAQTAPHEWLMLQESTLAAATNGEVFADPTGLFSKTRQGFKNMPDDVRLALISKRLGMIAQAGQYNLPRSLKRGDGAAAWLSIHEFVQATASLVFLVNVPMVVGYMPYYKWQFAALRKLSGSMFALLPNVGEQLETVMRLSSAACYGGAGFGEGGKGAAPAIEKINDIVEQIAVDIVKELKREHLTTSGETFLEWQRPYVEDHIASDDPVLKSL
jgi:tetratricopeptide (TPR) repeat protein